MFASGWAATRNISIVLACQDWIARVMRGRGEKDGWGAGDGDGDGGDDSGGRSVVMV